MLNTSAMVKQSHLRAMICMMTVCLAGMMHHHQQLLLLAADEDEAEDDDDDDDGNKIVHAHDDSEQQPKQKRTRCSYGRPDYNSSAWAVMLKETELLADPATEEAKKFRASFRVPYQFFLELVKNVKAGEWEGFMANTTGVGRLNYICVELKVGGMACLWSVQAALICFRYDSAGFGVPSSLVSTQQVDSYLVRIFQKFVRFGGRS